MILLLLISFTLFSFQQNPISKINTPNLKNKLTDSLTNELKKIYEEGYITGFSVAIVNENGTLYQEGIGYSNIKNKSRYTENTIQNVASISKILIGVALLKAQEMGKLDLDDPINKLLPFKVINPFYPDIPITIRHLANHTSTILDTDFYYDNTYVLKEAQGEIKNDFPEIPQTLNSPENRIPMSQFLKKMLYEKSEEYSKEGFLNKKPGELFEYSNVGATLAAYIIECATEVKFDEFTSRYILKPLNMNSSGWSFDEIDISQHSKLYANPTTKMPFYSLITYPDGGLITSANDLSKFLTELIKGFSGNGKLLSQESYEELFSSKLKPEQFTERNENNPYNSEFNYSIFIGFSFTNLIGHTGGDPGVASLMFFNPTTKTGRILIINTDINSQEGVNEFYSIMEKLGEYELKLDKYE